jgi:hypothetical protein
VSDFQHDRSQRPFPGLGFAPGALSLQLISANEHESRTARPDRRGRRRRFLRG